MPRFWIGLFTVRLGRFRDSVEVRLGYVRGKCGEKGREMGRRLERERKRERERERRRQRERARARERERERKRVTAKEKTEKRN